MKNEYHFKIKKPSKVEFYFEDGFPEHEEVVLCFLDSNSYNFLEFNSR